MQTVRKPIINNTEALNFLEYRNIVRDLFIPNAKIYWLDFASCTFLGWGFFLLSYQLPFLSLEYIVTFLIGSFLLYRNVLYVHEIAHLKRTDLPKFSATWNILCGIPLFVPSLMYHGVHTDHHSKHFYGTEEDGEYVPFGASSSLKSFVYLLSIFYSPILLFARWSVIGPLSFLHPKLRKLVEETLSHLVIDFAYTRTKVTKAERREWIWQELLCSVFSISLLTAIATGFIAPFYLVHLYGLFVLMFFVNSMRTLVAHRYRNRGEAISFEAQLLDSVNIEGGLLTELWAPLGLRYHGLHHLFPNIPYHNLGIAHRRLMKKLSRNACYHLTVEKNMWQALQSLWRSTRAHKQRIKFQVAKTMDNNSPREKNV